MTVVSGNIRIVRIFAGVPWRGGVKRQWGNRPENEIKYQLLMINCLFKLFAASRGFGYDSIGYLLVCFFSHSTCSVM